MVAAWLRCALVEGTDPDSNHYWGPDTNYYQLHVDMGVLVIGLQIARAALWTPLAAEERTQVAAWLATSRGSGFHHANHYFMGIHVWEFLEQEGFHHPSSRPLIDGFFETLATFYRGEGWFSDGVNQASDYYNAYAFHYYGLWWSRLYGKVDEARALRWREWTRLFLHDYESCFAASGENIPFGRSITYRFNASGVFALAVLEGVCDLPLGRMRRLCTRNLAFFLTKPIFQEQGCLSIGWTDTFEGIAESYLCSASPYWAAKAFAPLLIPPSHAFWTEPETELKCEMGDFAQPIRAAGLLLRSCAGETELINCGSSPNLSCEFMGFWKWTKTAYRTGIGFTIAHPDYTSWSKDSALTQRTINGRITGRLHANQIGMDDRHVHYVWNMGHRVGPVSTSVETLIFWKAGWLLQIHHYHAHQSTELSLGGYALGADSAASLTCQEFEPFGHGAWSDTGRGSVIQALHGFDGFAWDSRLDETTPRTHLLHEFHLTPVAIANVEGTGLLVALTWAGKDRAEAAPWKLAHARRGVWTLCHEVLGSWVICHDRLPANAVQ